MEAYSENAASRLDRVHNLHQTASRFNPGNAVFTKNGGEI